MGPLARATAKLPIEHAPRRKVAVLIAAYYDAGLGEPTIEEISERTGYGKNRVSKLRRRLYRSGVTPAIRKQGRRNGDRP